jgi:hypothetical protein
MSIELKIKSKHLGEEARIIRFEEHKLKKQVAWYIKQHYATGINEQPSLRKCKAHNQRSSLYEHRTKDVRRENRATFLARAYIAGKSYASVEQKRKPEREYEFSQFVLPRVVNMVAKYGETKVSTRIYDRASSKYIDNPALAEVKQRIAEWVSETIV